MQIQIQLKKHVLANSIKGNAENVINTIDLFCFDNWMMNIGNVKGLILDAEIKKKNPKRVLEIGIVVCR
jgi:catechol O-methyltransferase